MSRLATATIHLGALRHNLARVREQAPGAKVMAVVKADAYGHGLERVARALDDADAFGVAAIADGLRLRAAGHRQRIVVLSGPDSPADLAEMRRLDLDAVIHHDSQLAWLAADTDRRAAARVAEDRLGHAPAGFSARARGRGACAAAGDGPCRPRHRADDALRRLG